jgi:hypothetical protein
LSHPRALHAIGSVGFFDERRAVGDRDAIRDVEAHGGCDGANSGFDDSANHQGRAGTSSEASAEMKREMVRFERDDIEFTAVCTDEWRQDFLAQLQELGDRCAHRSANVHQNARRPERFGGEVNVFAQVSLCETGSWSMFRWRTKEQPRRVGDSSWLSVRR